MLKSALKHTCMFVIRSEQIGALGMPAFEREMVQHIARYFPERFLMMEEPAAMEVVRMSIARCAEHNVEARRDVCLFLNCALVLGSGFASDPKFSWAAELLAMSGTKDASERMTAVRDRMLRQTEVFHVEIDDGLVQRLTRIQQSAREIAGSGASSTGIDITRHLSTHCPEDVACFEPKDVVAFGDYAANKATEHGFSAAQDRSTFARLLFLLGAECDTDPQFHWIGSMLRQKPTSGVDERMELVLAETIIRMQKAMALVSTLTKEYDEQGSE